MDSELKERVLVVAAHPDDIDFGAAGTVATWTRAGVEVAYLIVTDGDAGGFDRSISRGEIPRIRRQEQQLAAKVVGVEVVEFLGYPDGRLVADLELRKDIARVIRRFRPTRVLCPSPERDLGRIPASHPDHLATGEATLCAVYPDARNLFAFPELASEGLEPHVVHEVWLMAHPRRDRFVDITETIDDKLAALSAHKSQLVDGATTLLFVRDWTSENAREAGLPPGRMAEAFFVVSIP